MEVGPTTVAVAGDGGPAAVDVGDLPPATDLDVVVDGRLATTVRTADPLPGELRCRFATVSDLHIGEGWTFGVLPTAVDAGGPDDPPAPRAVRAALRELSAWGAELLVVKGDLTHHARRDEFEEVAGILAEPGLPVVATRGNHDVRKGFTTDGAGPLRAAGVEWSPGGVLVRDLPGVRVIVPDCTLPERHPGSYRHVGDAILEAAGSTSLPVVVTQHHQLQRLPFPTHWPPGVLGPQSGRFLAALGEANPRSIVTSGHTHRHRARRVGSVLVTEVGSPKDHPGTWAGYVVHDGGIRQVVRRVAEPSVIRWTESTKRALFGIWGRWSPGTLADRCVDQTWG